MALAHIDGKHYTIRLYATRNDQGEPIYVHYDSPNGSVSLGPAMHCDMQIFARSYAMTKSETDRVVQEIIGCRD